MAVVLVIVIIALLVIAYLVLHKGQPTTVHTPGVKAPSVDIMTYVDKLITFITSKEGGILVGCIIIGTIVFSVWKKLGKVQVLMLAILAMFIAVGYGIFK